MLTRIAALVGVLCVLSGCVITPRVEMTRRIDFNYIYTPQAQLSYTDLMCCDRCTA